MWETPECTVDKTLTLNLDVVLQAVERPALTSKVYIGIPEQSKILSRRWKHVVKLLRMPGLGGC